MLYTCLEVMYALLTRFRSRIKMSSIMGITPSCCVEKRCSTIVFKTAVCFILTHFRLSKAITQEFYLFVASSSVDTERTPVADQQPKQIVGIIPSISGHRANSNQQREIHHMKQQRIRDTPRWKVGCCLSKFLVTWFQCKRPTQADCWHHHKHQRRQTTSTNRNTPQAAINKPKETLLQSGLLLNGSES